MSKRSQSAVELALIIVFMLLVFTSFIFFLGGEMNSIYKDKNRQLLEDVASVVKSELALASSVESGYHRTFTLPKVIDGLDYTITLLIDPSSEHKELIVAYVDTDKEYEHVEIMPDNIDGTIIKGENKIATAGNIVCINKEPCP